MACGCSREACAESIVLPDYVSRAVALPRPCVRFDGGEPAFDVLPRAQAHHRIASELRRVVSPAPKVTAQRVRDERVPAPERAPKRLAVAVPELLPPHDPAHGSPDEARQPDAHRQVEPNDSVRRAEDEIA